MSDTKQKNTKEESIFTPKRTVQYFFLNLIAFILAAMLIWPLMDLMFQGFDPSKYTWTWQNGILEPIAFGFTFTVIEFVCWNFFHKQK